MTFQTHLWLNLWSFPMHPPHWHQFYFQNLNHIKPPPLEVFLISVKEPPSLQFSVQKPYSLHCHSMFFHTPCSIHQQILLALSSKESHNLTYLHLCFPDKATIPACLGDLESLPAIALLLSFPSHNHILPHHWAKLHWCPISPQGKAQSITKVNQASKYTGWHGHLWTRLFLLFPYPPSSNHTSGVSWTQHSSTQGLPLILFLPLFLPQNFIHEFHAPNSPFLKSFFQTSQLLHHLFLS